MISNNFQISYKKLGSRVKHRCLKITLFNFFILTFWDWPSLFCGLALCIGQYSPDIEQCKNQHVSGDLTCRHLRRPNPKTNSKIRLQP